MCQAYAAEAAYINYTESRATIAGFFAAMEGKLRHENPHIDSPFEKYQRDAWNHGWSCFQNNADGRRILPWTIESQFGYAERIVVREYFERTGKLKKAWIRKLR